MSTQGKLGRRMSQDAKLFFLQCDAAVRLAHGPEHRDTRWCAELMKDGQSQDLRFQVWLMRCDGRRAVSN